ncbi:MAG: DUF1214 domain-containing protein [Erythrobacter sp.]|uniref:DUF1214 domain-containing protein n=1 Tax=Erythrobacter sp. TaxID=1042 RepID=UPI0025ECBD75|nr:DUF1214 domain-containing protein [Erythrobacter sp.]MCM0000327.1 DUF1214 domain-containing protein [Erythrobacter sp.]
MRGALRYLVGVVAGSLLGLGSALWLAGLWPARSNMAFGDIDVGGWRSDFATGSEAADPYTRARVARHGLLALAKTEAVYFTRATDESGAPLREGCSYRLSGGQMPAGWWSVTLYDAASMLPANTDGALSIDAWRAGGGAWSAIVAPERPADGSLWISSRGSGTFDLTLRLYMPDAALLADPNAALSPPVIKRLSCGEGGR